MKHLIETADLSSLGFAEYDRIILDSTTNEIAYRGVKYEYVDLGLPSGLKWAKCNVGAEKETDYGDYFQWGSITPNTDTPCDWINAPFNNGSSDYNETYFNSVKDTVCPNGILAKEYDAATQIMGSEWRMPTQPELKELVDNTTNEWIENYNGTGVNGRKFTSKTDTSKYIFIPAAGYCSNGSVYNVGRDGSFWSSSLYDGNHRLAFYFDNYLEWVHSYADEERYKGFVVRGVRK